MSLRVFTGRTIALLLPIAATLGCAAGDRLALKTDDQVTVFSIDGRFGATGKRPKDLEPLKGWPVLGKVSIKDAGARKKLVAAFNEGLAGAPDDYAKCFWPRHAIEIRNGDQTRLYVICFECEQFQVYVNDKGPVSGLIGRQPQKTLDAMLTEAGVELAPSAMN